MTNKNLSVKFKRLRQLPSADALVLLPLSANAIKGGIKTLGCNTRFSCSGSFTCNGGFTCGSFDCYNIFSNGTATLPGGI